MITAVWLQLTAIIGLLCRKSVVIQRKKRLNWALYSPLTVQNANLTLYLDVIVYKVARDCADILAAGQMNSGVYMVRINNIDVEVFCDMATEAGGWLVNSTTWNNFKLHFNRLLCLVWVQRLFTVWASHFLARLSSVALLLVCLPAIVVVFSLYHLQLMMTRKLCRMTPVFLSACILSLLIAVSVIITLCFSFH